MANNNKLNDLINAASRKMGTDPNDLKQKLETGQIDQILNSLSPKDSENIRQILNNPGKLKSILQSPQAKEMMSKFSDMNKK